MKDKFIFFIVYENTMNHNNLPILKQLYDLIGIPFVYGLPIAIPLTIVFYIMSLPFLRKGDLKNERSN